MTNAPSKPRLHFSLLALHGAILCANRTAWLILLFLTFLIAIAMTLLNTSNAPDEWLKNIWFLVLFFHASFMLTLQSVSRRKTLIFQSMQRLRPWLHTQVAVLCLFQLPFHLVLWGAFALLTQNPHHLFWNTIAAQAFTLSTSIAVCMQLQPHLLCLNASKSAQLLLITAAPWLLIAWILALSVGVQTLRDAQPIIPLLALASLICLQIASGAIVSSNEAP